MNCSAGNVPGEHRAHTDPTFPSAWVSPKVPFLGFSLLLAPTFLLL